MSLLTNRRKGSSFCNKAGAQANEDLSFSEYMESLGRGVEMSTDDKEEKKPSNEGDKAQSVCCLRYHIVINLLTRTGQRIRHPGR